MSGPEKSTMPADANLQPQPALPAGQVRYCGLRNLGFTCYANSVIQALYTSNKIRTQVITHRESGPFHTNLAGLFTRMAESPFIKSPGGRWYFPNLRPAKFIAEFRKQRPDFVKGEQHDAQEFLYFLLEFLHQEMNEARKRTRPATNTDKTSPEEAWQYHVTYVDDSLYSHIYMGQIESTLTCVACEHQSRSWECFWQLQLEVPNDAPTDGQVEPQPNHSPTPVSVPTKVTMKSCIEKLMAEETLSGDCAPTCAGCKRKQGSKKRQAVRVAPIYLIVHLKRFTPMGIKIVRPVPIEKRLTLATRQYALSSCVLHKGISGDGHYMTLYSEADTLWVLFNDEATFVNISDEDAHRMLADWGYIGFYRAIA